MSVGIYLNELEQRVARACVDLMRGRARAEEGESDIVCVARLSNIPEGHVLGCVKRWRFTLSADDEITWTEDNLRELEAHVLLPIHPPAAKPSQQFNVTAGAGSQVQVGDQVSGAQSMVTYGDVLQRLEGEIQRAPIPEAEKRSAIQKLGELAKSPGLAALLNLGATIVRAAGVG